MVEFDGEFEPGSKNRITSANGSISIKLEGDPGVKLEASTSNGEIDLKLLIKMTSSLDKRHVAGIIGDAKTELVVATSNGSISIE
jgi:DUF4097 and DUF4098 domain-containing protein YvlB